MNEQEYINSPIVKEFIKWLGRKLTIPNSFCHSYTMLKPKQEWSCNSIYDAYLKYRWPVNIDEELKRELNIQDNSYDSNAKALNYYSRSIRQAFISEDNVSLNHISRQILKWGGVDDKHNLGHLENRKEYLYQDYLEAKRLLTFSVDLSNNFSSIKMNSGFTKIYAMLFDDFIIYDGRVGAALGYLVRLFFEEYNLDPPVSDELAFMWGAAQPVKVPNIPHLRNPSKNGCRFKILVKNTPHTICNIKANWLVKTIFQSSKFGELSIKTGAMRAFESALFMIGYDLKGAK